MVEVVVVVVDDDDEDDEGYRCAPASGGETEGKW